MHYKLVGNMHFCVLEKRSGVAFFSPRRDEIGSAMTGHRPKEGTADTKRDSATRHVISRSLGAKDELRHR